MQPKFKVGDSVKLKSSVNSYLLAMAGLSKECRITHVEKVDHLWGEKGDEAPFSDDITYITSPCGYMVPESFLELVGKPVLSAQDKLDMLKKYFESGNDVPVKQATIKANDFWKIYNGEE